MPRITIPEMTSSTDNALLDAQIGTWYLIHTDIGITYCQPVSWRRAFGRVDWVVRLIGDDADSPSIQAGRFIKPQTPPGHANPKTARKTRPIAPDGYVGAERREGEWEVRDPNDPFARDFAEMSITEEKTGVKKKRKRRKPKASEVSDE